MSNRPRRPTLRALTGPGAIYGERISEFEQGYDPEEVDAYITAIEQELDEAVRILNDVCETFGHADALCVDEAVEFLASIEGGDNG